MYVKGFDFDTVFKNVCKELSESKIYYPRGLGTRELINFTYIVEHPLLCILTNPHRKLSEEYIKHELDWYLSGDLNIDKIKTHATMWEKIANPDGTVNSNYGYYIWKQQCFGKSQFDWVFESLVKDSDTRQAIINLNQPSHKYEGNKDFVCTISIQFFIRDNKLDCIVNMRSQDFIFGAGNDLPFFAYVHALLHTKLRAYYQNLNLGSITTNCGSLHIYERHFKMLSSIVNDTTNYNSKNLYTIIGG